MSICRQQWKHGEGYLHYLGLHFCKWSWRFGQDYWCPQLSIMQNHHRGMWLAPCDCLQEDSDSKHKTEVMTNNLNLELTAQPTQSCTQRHRVCYTPWKRMTWGRLHPQKVSGSSSKVLGPTYQAPNAQQRLQMRWFAEGSINNGAGPRLLCVWGRSPVGRCQPGQFKGAACAFCGEGRHTTRIIMTATSETYDVIVVGGGISGGCITISNLFGAALQGSVAWFGVEMNRCWSRSTARDNCCWRLVHWSVSASGDAVWEQPPGFATCLVVDEALVPRHPRVFPCTAARPRRCLLSNS